MLYSLFNCVMKAVSYISDFLHIPSYNRNEMEAKYLEHPNKLVMITRVAFHPVSIGRKVQRG